MVLISLPSLLLQMRTLLTVPWAATKLSPSGLKAAGCAL